MLYCTWMYTDLDFKTDRRQSKERVITWWGLFITLFNKEKPIEI